MRKRAAALVLMLAALPALAASPPREQLNTTLETLESRKHEAAQLQQKAALNQQQLAETQQRAASLAERLQVSERRVSKQEDALADTTRKLADTQAQFDTRKQEYAATVVNLLRMHAVPPTAVFTDTRDIHALMQAASVLQNTNGALAKQALKLKAQMQQLRDLRREASTREASTRTERAALQLEQQKLAQEVKLRQQAQAKLSADQAEAEAAVATLSRESANLQELIGKLEEERKSRPTPAKPARKPTGTTSAGGLRAAVAGEITHRFGEHKNANENWRGVVVRTRAKATVVSPADGEIVFTGPFRDYGTMVLIKHRSGLISLIAGLGEVRASLNQQVLRGEPVGTMPEGRAPEAYIELRDRDSKPIDPGGGFANLDGNHA
ncbi:MAG: murein hydrolase activator EnvC family protein [Rickettsiales bacterium]